MVRERRQFLVQEHGVGHIGPGNRFAVLIERHRKRHLFLKAMRESERARRQRAIGGRERNHRVVPLGIGFFAFHIIPDIEPDALPVREKIIDQGGIRSDRQMHFDLLVRRMKGLFQ